MCCPPHNHWDPIPCQDEVNYKGQSLIFAPSADRLFRPWDLCPDRRIKSGLTFIYNRRCVREENILDPHREGDEHCVMTCVHHLKSFIAGIDIGRQNLTSIRQILTSKVDPRTERVKYA